MMMVVAVLMVVVVTVVMLVMVVVVVVMLMLVMVVVVVIMAGFRLLLPVHCHRHVGACDAAGGCGPGLQVHAGKSQTVHGIQKLLPVIQQFIEGGHEHISRCPHLTFYIKCLHLSSSFIPSIWLIMLAR